MPAAPRARIEALALAIAAGSTVRAWARANGVPERTAYTWASTPEFKHRVAQLRQQIISRAVGRLAALSTKAAAALGRLLDDPDPEVRLKSARAIFSDLVSTREHVELSERLAGLKEILDGHGQQPPPRG
jgi:hypothetical protein